MHVTSPRPLCVDLDGTLIATDTLWESIFLLLRRNPLYLFMLPWWLLKGKAYFKQQIAQRTALAVETLPYREAVLLFLHQQREAGRTLILITAAHEKIAHAVANHLKLFKEVIGSSATLNLKGEKKVAWLDQHFGAGNYDYMGDSVSDLPIFRAAHTSYLVAPSRYLQQQFSCPAEQIFPAPRRSWKIVLKVLRPHQWAKNVLVFTPLILSQQFLEVSKIFDVTLAFFCFSLVASSGYVINDLLDLAADRVHTTKKNRPFASGSVPISYGLPIFLGLIGFSAAISLIFINTAFTTMLLFYLIITLSYSFYLKRKMIVDILVLAGLYTHRIIAGGVAISTIPSGWLLAFSMFFFISLAFLKRYIELLELNDLHQLYGSEHRTIKNRNYWVDDLEMIASMGPTSGYLAVLVYALYINTMTIKGLYAAPHVLWLICPILLYWLTRIWFLAKRRLMVDDPVQFAIDDRVSWIALVSIALLFIIASFIRFA
jgi:4-hydroxybenzoate polyprenyltransferase/phosphoserine phosphatase